MDYSEVIANRCLICNGLLIKNGLSSIFSCENCTEHFPVGKDQFDQLYGTKKSFTARELDQLSTYGTAQKFCSSVDQILKSDLPNLLVRIENFRSQELIETLTRFIKQHKPLKALTMIVGDTKCLRGAKSVLDAVETSTTITILTLIIEPDDFGSPVIRTMLKNNKSIKTLFLECSENLDLMLAVLPENSTIESLHIQKHSIITKPISFGNSLKSIHINSDRDTNAFLEDAFTANHSIETFTLRSSNFNVVSAIKHNKSIRTLNIHKIRETAVGFDKLSDLFKSHSTLTSISLYASDPIDYANMQLLCDGITQSGSLRKFFCSVDHNEYFSVQSLELLLGTLIKKKRIEEITIYASARTELDPVVFTYALKDPECSVKVLNLSPQFKKEQSIALALALEANKSLEHVDLGSTNFSAEALKILHRWLVKNSQLKIFRTGHRSSEEDPTFDLAEIIQKNTTLTTLNYWSDPLPKDQIKKLFDALAVNDTLTHLLINCNELEHVIYDLVNGINNFALREFSVGYCSSYIEQFTKRNIEYQSQMHINTIILIYNIARDKSLFEQLPREIWLLIFEQLRYPGITNFRSKAERIFNSYFAA